MKPSAVASVVLFHNRKDQVSRVVSCLERESCVARIWLVDNSSDERLSEFGGSPKVTYVRTGENLGFGKAHNFALRASLEKSDYVLVLNPDIQFEEGSVQRCLEYMDKHPDVGLLMPKVLYPDGRIQNLCKLLPTPLDLVVRRFIPVAAVRQWINRRYELRMDAIDRPVSVPSLSGCFMVLRSEALRQVGLFDERYFMYMEDVDLSRRIGEHWKVVYFPEATVVHEFAKGSYRNPRLLRYHIHSAIRYFMKWGWVFDSGRRKANAKALMRIDPTRGFRRQKVRS